MEKFIKVFVNQFYMTEVFIEYGIDPRRTDLKAFLDGRGIKKENKDSQTYTGQEGTIHWDLVRGYIMVKTKDPLGRDREFVDYIMRIVNSKRIVNVGSEEISLDDLS